GAILRQPGPGRALGRQRDDVRAGAALAGRVLDAQRRQRLRDLAGCRLRVLRRAGVEGVDAAGAEVALGGQLVQGDFAGVTLGVGLAAEQALLLVGVGDHADAARRAPRHLLDQAR